MRNFERNEPKTTWGEQQAEQLAGGEQKSPHENLIEVLLNLHKRRRTMLVNIMFRLWQIRIAVNKSMSKPGLNGQPILEMERVTRTT
jgi:hypothetical protein